MDIADWKLSAMSVKHYQIVTFDIAGEAGFEPTSTVLETAELPLFYSPILPLFYSPIKEGVKRHPHDIK